CVLVSDCERRSTLPPTPERLIELNDAQQLVQLDLPEVQLGLQQIPVRVESVQLRVDTSLVSHVRQALALLKDSNKPLLFNPGLLPPLMGNECVGDFGECCLDRLPVLRHCDLSLSFRQPHG